MYLQKLAAFAVVTGVIAVAVPQIAPSLIAGLSRDGEADATADNAPAVPAAEPEARPAPRLHQVVLAADEKGHFVAEATINGRRIEAMIDTGATVVALNQKTAERLGIYLSSSAFKEPLSTGNGVVGAAPVTLDEISLGDITVRRVGAVVVPGDALPINLLGMSYLSRLTRYEAGGGQLMLEQ